MQAWRSFAERRSPSEPAFSPTRRAVEAHARPGATSSRCTSATRPRAPGRARASAASSRGRHRPGALRLRRHSGSRRAQGGVRARSSRRARGRPSAGSRAPPARRRRRDARHLLRAARRARAGRRGARGRAVLASLGRRRPRGGAVPVEVPLTTRLYEDPGAERRGHPRAGNHAADARAVSHLSQQPRRLRLRRRAAPRHRRPRRRARPLGPSDEVYADYVYEGTHASIARLPGMAERTLSAYSLSKSHALAGARVGFLVAPERVVSLARSVATHTVFNVPVASQRVALAALEAPPHWMNDARRAYRDARDATMHGARGIGVGRSCSRAGATSSWTSRPCWAAGPSRRCSSAPSTKGCCSRRETDAARPSLVGAPLLHVRPARAADRGGRAPSRRHR